MGWIVAALAIFAARGFALWLRRREQRRLARMSRVLDDAPADVGYQCGGEVVIGCLICGAAILAALCFVPRLRQRERRRLARQLDDVIANVGYQWAVKT